MYFKRLGDVFKITSGGTTLTSIREYYDSGTIHWVKTGDLKVRHLSKIPNFITKLGLENSSAKIFPKNTVLIAMYGATIGNCSILKTEAATNQACAALLPNENVNEEYLFFFLSSIKKELIKKGVGGGQPNISATILKEIKIPLPSLKIQIQIAEILSKADSLINKRKEGINLLDKLLKSTFFEMFGDPFSNPKKFEIKKFENIFENIIYGTSTPPIYDKVGIPFIRATNIKKGRIVEKDLVFISQIEANKIPKCKLSEGDMIIVRSGANTGDTATIPEKYENAYAAFDLIIKINKISSIFFNELLNSNYGKKIIKPLTQRSGQPHINSEQVKNLKLYNPPIELQNEFVTILKKVELLRVAYINNLKELENMSGILNQKAFKGELKINNN